MGGSCEVEKLKLINMGNQISSVNFHLWEPCNMRCKFCFGSFKDVKYSILPKGHLPKEEAIKVVQELVNQGFEKITFAGGEPTLCPWLPELIKIAKKSGLTTMIVSNGSNLNDTFLQENQKYLDWIAISIDSLNVDTNKIIGRAVSGKKSLPPDYYFKLVEKIKQYDFGFKVNTVVNSQNYNEDMGDFIKYSKPKRWKIFQVLPITGQNDLYIDEFKITDEQFNWFLNTHSHLQGITKLVSENNNEMRSSYAMVDPAGRFYDNTKGTYHYSKPILEIGVKKAIKQVDYDFNKFISRDGQYDWKIQKKSFF